jgi:hypothetical protein
MRRNPGKGNRAMIATAAEWTLIGFRTSSGPSKLFLLYPERLGPADGSGCLGGRSSRGITDVFESWCGMHEEIGVLRWPLIVVLTPNERPSWSLRGRSDVRHRERTHPE